MPTAPQTTDELYQALGDNRQRPYGRARSVTAEELCEAAEQFDDTEALVHALLELQHAYTYGSEPRKSPVVFARLLALFDEQPEVFDERLRHQLFWRFKWVANALRQLPEMPLASNQQWLTEMRDRYTAAGLGLQPYYGQAYQLAAHTGQDTTAAYELWAGRARTPYSDCEACEICERALYHVESGDDERALEIWEPVLAGQESCQEEPARSISYALLPLLRTGRTERARALHLAGYRAARRNPSMSGEVGRHLEFCALTGNEARGLELLAENRGLFDEVDSPSDRYDFLTGVEVLLQRVESLGHGDLPAAGYAGRTWTVTSLRGHARESADDLAARFDARNRTSAHTDRRRARLERTALLEELELTLRTRALHEVTPAATPAATPAVPAGRTPTPVAEALPELIAQARALEEQAHPDAAACWARLRTLAAAPDYAHPDDPAAGPVAWLRADLLADEADQAHEKDQYALATGLYDQAAALYDEAGQPGHAALARARALLAAAQQPAENTAAAGADADADADAKAEDDTDAKAAARAAELGAAHAALVRLQQEQEEQGGLAPYQRARLLRLRATALALRLQASGRAEHAAPVHAEVDLLYAFATEHGIATQRSGARLLRASTYAVSGDLPAARAEVDGALGALDEHGPAWHVPRALGLRARISAGLREPQGAHDDLVQALRLAAHWPSEAMHTARLHHDLAEVCMHLGRPEQALTHLTRSAEVDLRAGSRVEAFCTYSNAARLSLDLGRVEDTIALLDSLLAEPDAAGGDLDDRLLAQLRLTRARALREGEDLKAATAEFLTLAAESATWDDDPGSHAMIAAETAVLLGEAGDFDRARQAADQALAAHEHAPRYEQMSGSLRELARQQAEQQGADGLSAARAYLADAAAIAERARAAGFQARGRSLETALAYEHGRVGAYAGAYDDALTALEEALSLLGEPAAGDEQARERAGEWAECVRLAGLVEGLYLERPEPAVARLEAAAAALSALGLTEDAGPLTSLAARLREDI